MASLQLSRRTLAGVRQNLFWALAYTVVGIPVAASSVRVVTSSLRLRHFTPDGRG